MQLLTVALYSVNGERRLLRFQAGALNIITGASATGKSSILDIVDYCLGRSRVIIASGPISDTVAWYGCLFQLPTGSRALVARPAPRTGAASSTQAMLELGDAVDIPEYSALHVNADTNAVRTELGARIGIEENRGPLTSSAGTSNLEAGIAHAALLSFQGQSEIASRSFLFHRQGESGIAEALKATLPYFLGAATKDQALKRELLITAQRDLRRVSSELAEAERSASEVDAQLISLVSEAYAAGLLSTAGAPSAAEAEGLLRAATAAPRPAPALDDEVARRIEELEATRADARRRLRDANEIRSLLLQQQVDEGSYQTAIGAEYARLQALELIPERDSRADGTACPACGSQLDHADPSIDDLNRAVEDVAAQLDLVASVRPRRGAALGSIDAQIDALRQQLRGIEDALTNTRRLAPAAEQAATRAESQAFVKGRIDSALTRFDGAADERLLRLRELVANRRLSVEQLQADIDPDREREQMESRLAIVGADMSEWAHRLQLEHRAIRIDATALTVVADAESGPIPMFRIGSAANWVGFHLLAHLALHRYFVRQQRPTLHFLMLDQPSQAYYPSEAEKQSGTPENDSDRVAVTLMYQLMRDVVTELQPSLQLIVVDHANLAESWFQESIRENWRGGAKLIPASWIDPV